MPRGGVKKKEREREERRGEERRGEERRGEERRGEERRGEERRARGKGTFVTKTGHFSNILGHFCNGHRELS